MTRALLIFLVACALLFAGCGDSRGPAASVPHPHYLTPLDGYASATSPVTSSAPAVTVWARADLLAYVPHPSVRLTRAVLRPGAFNTPLERLLEEVSLTIVDRHPDVGYAAGPPAGWTVVAVTGLITLSTKAITTADQHGNVVTSTVPDKQVGGLTDVVRRVIWCTATDDAVTPEGSPLMVALPHELLHAHLYEEALKRGLTHDAAARESASIDP